MPVDMKKLFKDHGINIVLDGGKGVGVPVTDEILKGITAEDLKGVTNGQNVQAGDMLTATFQNDENGNPKLNDNGQPKRVGGYIKLGVDNDLEIAIPRAEAGASPYMLDASNTRRAAAQILRMAREARIEVAEIAEEHEKAMEAYDAELGRGERPEEPVARTPKHNPDVFTKFDGFVSAAEAVITSELDNAFSTVSERKDELMASLSIRNERRNTLSPKQIQKAAEGRSLREEIARMDPNHPMGVRSVVVAYTGTGEAAQEAVDALRDGPISLHSNKGIPKMGPSADLLDPLVASFTSEKPGNVHMAMLQGMQRRRFEQDMGRYENPEIGATLKTQIDAVMNARMSGYNCDTKFFTHKGADMLMVNDLGGSYLYVMDADARAVDLDLEALNRPATEEDVPTDEQLVELRQVLAEVTFDNGDDIVFDDPDAEEEDDNVPDFG